MVDKEYTSNPPPPLSLSPPGPSLSPVHFTSHYYWAIVWVQPDHIALSYSPGSLRYQVGSTLHTPHSILLYNSTVYYDARGAPAVVDFRLVHCSYGRLNEANERPRTERTRPRQSSRLWRNKPPAFSSLSLAGKQSNRLLFDYSIQQYLLRVVHDPRPRARAQCIPKYVQTCNQQHFDPYSCDDTAELPCASIFFPQRVVVYFVVVVWLWCGCGCSLTVPGTVE